MIADASLYPAARTALTQSQPLTQSQKTALKNELDSDPTGRGYVGKAGADLLLLLNDVYETPNPEPRGTVPAPPIPINKFGTILTTFLPRVNALPTDNPYRLPILDNYKLLIDSVKLMSEVDPATQTFIGVFDPVQKSGAMSKAEYDALTTIPDPAYQAVLVMPSRASVLGLGIVEMSDLRDLSDLESK